MAQKLIVAFTDDLDGSDAAETISFSFERKNYEIDLNEGHAEEFRSAMQKYIKAARSTDKSKAQPKTVKKTGAISSKDIRAWAETQNIEMNPRGRLKQEVVDQYMAAHK